MNDPRPISHSGKTYKRVVCNFSCGAASAVATKLAIQEFGPEHVKVVYQETHSEHPDNERFIRECEVWFGVPVERQHSKRYWDIWEVFTKRRYLNGAMGALCTSELKKMVAQEHLDFFNDLEVFGYTVEEKHRIDRFIRENEDRCIYAILATGNGVTKVDCYAILKEAGIDLPVMYLLGYKNNNCIGCVKGGIGYWNKIRVDFPEVFWRMASLERELSVSVCVKRVKRSLATPEQLAQWDEEATPKRKAEANKKKDPTLRLRWYLDELDPTAGRYESEPSISCGVICEKGN